MIYISVQNKLHYIWSDFILKSIKRIDPKMRFGLIKIIPSMFIVRDAEKAYDEVYDCLSFLGDFKSSVHFIQQNKIKRSYSEIKFSQKDVLFIFSEYELGNHCLAERAKSAGAKVFIVDDGVGTFIINNFYMEKDCQQWKQFLLFTAARYFYGMYHTRRVDGGKGTIPVWRLDDRLYDAYILRYRIPIKRDIDLQYVNMPFFANTKKQIALNEDAVLILGGYYEKMYFSMEHYLSFLKSVMVSAVKNFTCVFFKFHHCEVRYFERREYKEFREFLTKINVTILEFERPKPVELLLGQMEIIPKFVVSNISTALLNCFEFGCEPIFTCHLHPDLGGDFATLTRILQNLNYRFIRSFSDISPQYCSGLKDEDVFSQKSFETFVYDSILD